MECRKSVPDLRVLLFVLKRSMQSVPCVLHVWYSCSCLRRLMSWVCALLSWVCSLVHSGLLCRGHVSWGAFDSMARMLPCFALRRRWP